MLFASTGQRKLVEIPAFTTLDGVSINVNAYVITGFDEGHTLYVGAATHGNEIQGVEACRRLAENIRPEEVHGTLIIVPVQNPMAFKHRVRLNPIDGKDLDRLYPGGSDGTATEKLADVLYTSLASKADCVIDLHAGGFGSKNVPHIYVPATEPTRTSFDSLELAKAFGADVLIHTQPGVDYHFDLEHLSPFYCNTRGAAGLYPEIGEGGYVDEAFVEFYVTGVKNVMRKLKMLKGAVQQQGKLRVATRTTIIRASTAGILKRRFELGQEVQKGDLVAEIFGLWGGHEEVRAPVAGVIQWSVTFGTISAGEHIAWMSHN